MLEEKFHAFCAIALVALMKRSPDCAMASKLKGGATPIAALSPPCFFFLGDWFFVGAGAVF